MEEVIIIDVLKVEFSLMGNYDSINETKEILWTEVSNKQFLFISIFLSDFLYYQEDERERLELIQKRTAESAVLVEEGYFESYNCNIQCFKSEIINTSQVNKELMTG